ncbi:hypothetical protein [Rhizobium sp. C104]|uniref:hypothetical protein n=1 Tax=Rhizobium sp. C104 TaxID=2917727 RepID=UPI001EF807AA|nr:hypothetical protein [Rhizobium sp. C104]
MVLFIGRPPFLLRSLADCFCRELTRDARVSEILLKTSLDLRMLDMEDAVDSQELLDVGRPSVDFSRSHRLAHSWVLAADFDRCLQAAVLLGKGASCVDQHSLCKGFCSGRRGAVKVVAMATGVAIIFDIDGFP